MKSLKNISIIALAVTLSYGCSSSGGGGTPAPSPNGIYSGSITGGATSGAPINGGEKGIVYNGKFMIFSTALDIQQLFESTITTTGNNFSGTINYYNNKTSVRGQLDLNATFTERTNINADFTNSTISGVNDGAISLTADMSLYNKGSSTAAIVGSWQGTHGNLGDATSLAIDTNGIITSGSDLGNDPINNPGGCNFTGSVIPANTSINVYNVIIDSTGGTNCTSLPANTYKGLAWTEGSNDSTLNLTVTDGINSRSVVLTKN